MKRLPTTQAEATTWAMNNNLTPAHMVTMIAEVDATAMEKFRSKMKLNGVVAPSFTALVIKAAAQTMKQNPQANRAILGPFFFKRLYQFESTDISVAVEKNLPYQPGAAYATKIDNTEKKSLNEITDELQGLAKCTEETHEGYRLYMKILKYVPRPLNLWLINLPHLIPSFWKKYRGSAAWVNAPSKSGADIVMTTWPWPITFSFGVVKERAVVVNSKVVARATMPIVMVFDRRIMGGGPAGRIFAQFREILESYDHETPKETSDLKTETKSLLNTASLKSEVTNVC